MSIRRIKIENVRGIKSLEIADVLHPNKPIIFVAPNGFGKTSIATAFDSLKTNRLDVSEQNKYKNCTANESIIQIEDDNKIYIANNYSNSISSKYNIEVIKSQVKSKATTKKFGNYSSSTSSMIVEPIVLYNTIPETAKIIYSVSEAKKSSNISSAKLIYNFSENFNDNRFVKKFCDLKKDFFKLNQSRNLTKLKKIINEIDKKHGNKEVIANYDLEDVRLELIEPFENIVKKLDEIFLRMTFNERVVNVIQLINVYINNEKSLVKICKYYSFLLKKNEINDMLSLLNCTWKQIKSTQKGQKLVIEFPKANEISNGERDILCFVGKLFEARQKLNKEDCILIIDEIFDYLDDANIIAAQYFIIKFINQFKEDGRNLYPIILTHLDPYCFNTYSFSKKRVIYLDKISQSSNKYNINNILKNRENCRRDNIDIYNLISSNYLHYSESNENACKYLSDIGIEKQLLTPEEFRNVAIQELEEYKSGKNYDIAWVCCGLRILIEQRAYESLGSNEGKAFLTKHTTVDKITYAKEQGVNIPETHFLLSIIYNEGMHLDAECNRLNPIATKLKNKVIKKMISEI
jgi:hypothetical protein